MQLKALTSASSKLLRVLATLRDSGFRAWLAGGCVRDALLGRPSQDFDVVTDASVEDVQRLFPKTVAVGAAFGVVLVLSGDEEFEIAQFRKESDYRDGRRPSLVEPASPEEDARRRDLTVNALFYDPQSEELFDFVEGLKDLKAHRLRAVGDARRRFGEDHLRILRAVRFRGQLLFEWDADLERAIRDDVGLLAKVSRERVREELARMTRSPGWRDLIGFLVEARVCATLFTDLVWSADAHVPLNARDDEQAWWEWGLWAYRSGNTVEKVQRGLETLRLSRAESRSLENFLFWFQDAATWQGLRRGALVEKCFAPGAREGYRAWALLHPGWAGADAFEELLRRHPSPPAPWIRAEDLPRFQGSELGRILREAYHRQLEGLDSGRDELLAKLSSPD